MPNDTTPLLPPDPDKPGRYWIKRPDELPLDMWEWDPHNREWWRRTDDKDLCSPDLAGNAGYTLATRHRILTPGELEAVYAAAGQMHSQKEAARRVMNRSMIGGYDWRQASVREAAFAEAAAMLRDALGGGQE